MTQVVYVQYTNPGAYPPLEHSAAVLASSGVSVRVLGTTAVGTDTILWASRPGVQVSIKPVGQSGMRQRIDYLLYALRVFGVALRSRPEWLYASDALAIPIALAVRTLTGVKVLYHEHDEPTISSPSRFMRLVLRARRRLLRVAEEVVVPNAARGARLAELTSRQRPVHVVWNCPLTSDVGPSAAPLDGPLRIIYQGSINRIRLPISIIEALAEVGHAELMVIGYETIGSRNYTSEIMREAERLGVADRVTMLGAIPQRRDMLDITSRCHVGLSLMPMNTTDPNEANMAGASNKAFDYMARGLGLIVSDLPSWRTMFVEPGFALACDPREPASVVRALRWYATHREDARRRGLAAQQRIRDGWNYEAQFAPVARAILGSDARALHPVSVVA